VINLDVDCERDALEGSLPYLCTAISQSFLLKLLWWQLHSGSYKASTGFIRLFPVEGKQIAIGKAVTVVLIYIYYEIVHEAQKVKYKM